MNNNAITNIDKVKNLQYLYELTAKTNQIASLEFLCDPSVQLQYLQSVDLSTNKLTKLPQIHANALRKLNLEEN